MLGLESNSKGRWLVTSSLASSVGAARLFQTCFSGAPLLNLPDALPELFSPLRDGLARRTGKLNQGRSRLFCLFIVWVLTGGAGSTIASSE